MQTRMKIIVIGPSGVGKTAISNLISGHSQTPSQVYHPTSGVRILELEKEPPRANRQAGESTLQIELWDCSGDPRYEKCWSAFRKEAVGVIFVYDGEDPRPDMSNFVANFPQRMGLHPSQCIAFAHYKNSKPKGNNKPPKGIERVSLYETSMDNTSNILMAFDKLFGMIYSMIMESQEKAENQIISNRD